MTFSFIESARYTLLRILLGTSEAAKFLIAQLGVDAFDEGSSSGEVKMAFGFFVALGLLFLGWTGWSYFVAQRFKDRFANAFIEEFKHAYPDTASLLTPGVGAQIAYIVINNKKLAMQLDALGKKVAARPEVGNESYPYFDSDYSPKTQQLIIDLVKKKIDLAGQIFNCLPMLAQAKVAGKMATLELEGLDPLQQNQEKQKHFGLEGWKFGVYMNIIEITSRAVCAAN